MYFYIFKPNYLRTGGGIVILANNKKEAFKLLEKSINKDECEYLYKIKNNNIPKIIFDDVYIE
jgi:hypothetical protein